MLIFQDLDVWGGSRAYPSVAESDFVRACPAALYQSPVSGLAKNQNNGWDPVVWWQVHNLRRLATSVWESPEDIFLALFIQDSLRNIMRIQIYQTLESCRSWAETTVPLRFHISACQEGIHLGLAKNGINVIQYYVNGQVSKIMI